MRDQVIKGGLPTWPDGQRDLPGGIYAEFLQVYELCRSLTRPLTRVVSSA